MYRKILVPLENTTADQTILDHIRPLARMTGAALLLVHVADGWVARNYDRLNLVESDEIRQDRAYLAAKEQELQAEGFAVEHYLAMGEPADEIVRLAQEHQVDLIAMSTHGHRFLSDLIYGSTANKVRHLVPVPVLLLKVSAA
ncbi:MAG: universal stress protein [Candidatus Latescibacteria bacterium]|nr:universal stress protein [Candidatus Latescibacterota bacterium]